MDYLELECTVDPAGENVDILIAYLAAIGFSMFEETEQGVKAYIDVKLFNQKELDSIPTIHANVPVKIDYVIRAAEKKNWNEEWESNFKPVVIGKDVYVRAEYHMPDPYAKFEIIIQPRMAFGTGHHATTSLMMEAMLKIDFNNRKVLDMGCGTAILAILADKMGASDILAIDNDPVATENAVLNCTVNGVNHITVMEGDAKTPGNDVFDVILANINRNIILEDIPLYNKNLREGGSLLLSGFYFQDLEIITEKAKISGLNFKEHKVLDNWCQAVFIKHI